MVDGVTQAASMDDNGGETNLRKVQDVRQKTQVDYLPVTTNIVELRPRVVSKSAASVGTEIVCYSLGPPYLKQEVAEVVSVDMQNPLTGNDPNKGKMVIDEGKKVLVVGGGLGHMPIMSHSLDIFVGQASGPISPSSVKTGETLGLVVDTDGTKLESYQKMEENGKSYSKIDSGTF
ncbi:hypothetical protein ACOSQ2_019745 [Xanthoceras sorbifolium]